MGVEMDTIILFGHSLDPEDYTEEIGELVWDEFGYRESDEGDMIILYDGMGGNYFYVGYLVKVTDDRGPPSFNETISISENSFDKYKDKVQGLDNLMHDLGLESQGEPCFHILTHHW